MDPEYYSTCVGSVTCERRQNREISEVTSGIHLKKKCRAIKMDQRNMPLRNGTIIFRLLEQVIRSGKPMHITIRPGDKKNAIELELFTLHELCIHQHPLWYDYRLNYLRFVTINSFKYVVLQFSEWTFWSYPVKYACPETALSTRGWRHTYFYLRASTF